MHPRRAAGPDVEGARGVVVEARHPQVRVLLELDAAVAAIPRGEQHEAGGRLRGVEAVLPVRWRQAALPGDDPNLQEMRRFGRGRVVFAVHDARARTQVLNLAGADDRAVSQAVAVFERTLEDVRQDFHVVVRMRAEPRAGQHAVVVDHAERAMPNVRRVEVLAERKAVAALEPSQVGPAPLVASPDADHDFLPVAGSPFASRPTPGIEATSRPIARLPQTIDSNRLTLDDQIECPI